MTQNAAPARPAPAAPSTAWRLAASAWCRRTGVPADWPELFEASWEHSRTPRTADFEDWALSRLAQTWAGEGDDRLTGQVAAYLVQEFLAESGRKVSGRYRLSPEEWEDLVADAAATALRVFSSRRIEHPRGYLYRTLQRAVWSYLKKTSRTTTNFDQELVEDHAPTPEDRAYWRRMLVRVRQCVDDRLSDKDRAILQGLIIDGESAATVGAAVGLSANAVHVRTHRIRRRLRDALDGELSFAA